jgi:hypothetical protein
MSDLFRGYEDDERLNGEDRAGIKVWLDAKELGFPDASGRQSAHAGTMRLAVIRSFQPRAFRWLCHNIDLAADIAVRRHWAVDVEPRRRDDPTQSEAQAVTRAAREAVAVLAGSRLPIQPALPRPSAARPPDPVPPRAGPPASSPEAPAMDEPPTPPEREPVLVDDGAPAAMRMPWDAEP